MPNDGLTAPHAARKPHQIELHGERWTDDYFWLRERDNPDVLAYLEAENAYLEAAMAHTEVLQDTLYAEMRGRIQEADLSVPVRMGDYFYYERTEERRQYPVYCRKKGDLDADEEILLDQNELAQGYDFTELGVVRVSPDHRLLAYSVDFSGAEHFTLHVKDLQTGELLPDVIPDTYYSVEWAEDNRTLFYNTLDDASRPYKIFRHTLGEDPAQDTLVFHEPESKYYVSLRKTKSRRFLIIHLFSSMTSEEWFISAAQPQEPPRVVQARRHGLEYNAEHHGDYFYITHNDDALDFQVARAPLATPDLAHWETVIPHTPGVKLDRVEAFRDYLVLHLREGGLRGLRIVPVTDGAPQTADAHPVAFQDAVYTVWGSDNPEFDTATFRLTYASLARPKTVYDYDMAARTLTFQKQEPVLGGFDPDNYVTERHWAQAEDGVLIPVSVVYRKGALRTGGTPTWLYAYGSYGASIDPVFNSNRLSLLDRGMVFAIAHIRGGGEMGRAWYDNGKLLHKKNTFTDFVACAEYLVAQGITTPEQLVVAGRSAGGLLMGAVLNLRPDLFKAAIAGVPFVDVISTMMDPTIPLTTGEYEEWGNPADPAYYAYMKSYSPYDNLQAVDYPHILATAGLNDPRVQYWEPAKWVAKLRTVKRDGNRLLLKTNMSAGHAGASGRFDYLQEVAFEYAFFLETLGLTETPPQV